MFKEEIKKKEIDKKKMLSERKRDIIMLAYFWTAHKVEFKSAYHFSSK